MTKSWLIRTSNNYIFGPLSKKKILELYQNKSIQENDEICCGNGFWFYVREEKLVKKYLLEDNVQDFNPVSEAMDVLSAPTLDLQDPTMASKLEDTQVINIREIEEEDDSDEDNAEDAAEEITEEPTVEVTAHQSEEENSHDKKKSKSTGGVKSFFSNTTLTVIMFLIIVFLLSLVYYRKRILKEIISAINPIGSVYAQTDMNLKKKILF